MRVQLVTQEFHEKGALVRDDAIQSDTSIEDEQQRRCARRGGEKKGKGALTPGLVDLVAINSKTSGLYNLEEELEHH
jgi:hypothetical protein